MYSLSYLKPRMVFSSWLISHCNAISAIIRIQLGFLMQEVFGVEILRSHGATVICVRRVARRRPIFAISKFPDQIWSTSSSLTIDHPLPPMSSDNSSFHSGKELVI